MSQPVSTPQTKADLVRRQIELEDDIRKLDAKIAAAASGVRVATIAFLIGLIVFVIFHWIVGSFILLVSLLAYFSQKNNVNHNTKYRDLAHAELVNVRVASA